SFPAICCARVFTRPLRPGRVRRGWRDGKMTQGGHKAATSVGQGPASRLCPEPTRPDDPSPETSAMRVLLVEDHKPLVWALCQGLEEENFAVDVARDGEEADVKARNTDYDVIILDLMLPKIDGLTLLQRWRRDNLKTHVLVLTARGGIDDKVRC